MLYTWWCHKYFICISVNIPEALLRVFINRKWNYYKRLLLIANYGRFLPLSLSESVTCIRFSNVGVNQSDFSVSELYVGYNLWEIRSATWLCFKSKVGNQSTLCPTELGIMTRTQKCFRIVWFGPFSPTAAAFHVHSPKKLFRNHNRVSVSWSCDI